MKGFYVCQDFFRAKVAATEFCRLVEHQSMLMLLYL